MSFIFWINVIALIGNSIIVRIWAKQGRWEWVWFYGGFVLLSSVIILLELVKEAI